MLEKVEFENPKENSRKALAQSIRTISVEELRKLGDELFRFVDDPWRHAFVTFIDENRNSTFHRAETNDGVHLVYCRDGDKGIWFLPGSGKGPLQERGRKMMKEIIETGH